MAARPDNSAVSRTTPFRSASLAARLLTLVVLPMLALTVLAVQRIEDERHTASEAENVVEAVGMQQAVADILPAANLERIALEGLARVDELGIPRPLIMTLAGVDLEEVYTGNTSRLDAALDRLADSYGQVVLDDGSRVIDNVRAVRRDLQTQRALSSEGAAALNGVAAAFERLDTLLAATIAAAHVPSDLPTSLTRNAAQLAALSQVLGSAGDYGELMLSSLVAPDDSLAAAADRAYATHVAYLDVFANTLDPDERERLAGVRDRFDALLGAVPDRADGGATLATDPAYVQASAAAILGMLDYLEHLQSYSGEFHTAAGTEVSAAADEARLTAQRTLWLAAGIATVTITLIAIVLWSVLVPLRRLRARADAITRGEIALAPLAARGPSDLRALTSAMNDMLDTLHRVNDEITRLAAGDVDPGETADLPGAIGVSLRESVRHLAAVTAQLHRSEQLSSAIVTKAADAIWTTDEDGRIRTANEASGHLTRMPPHEQIGRSIGELLSATSGEAVVTVPYGPAPKVLVANSVIESDGEVVSAVIAHDISERSRFEERLAYQANHDALTGLPNRFAVLDHLDHLAQIGAEDVAVLFVDLDTFKSVNDTHGHAVGDKVLSNVASTLSRCVRGDEFVGRLGGDEFVVVVREFSQPADVVSLGYRVIRAIEQPQEHDGNVFVLSASVGVAIQGPGVAALDTIRHADNAVYQAKRRGRGRVELFDATMQEEIEHEAALELALRQAVRNHELVIHLQPVFDLANGRITGAEALVRWERPGFGLVPPGDFIPIAERSSLIYEIERWVLTQACERIADWRRRDPDCSYRIAVNISGRHLIEGDLLDDIDAALVLTGADPGMLELELTETQLLEDLARATSVLDTLRSRGITIAVDDFGTGYSSMTYLRHLPIDVVKIDRSFVARATEHGYDSTVIEALLTIGRALGLSVIAEGVETEAQLDYVRARGCHRAQGFLLARPMPVAEAEAMMCTTSVS